MVTDGGAEAEGGGGADDDGAIFPGAFSDEQGIAGAVCDIAHVNFRVAEADAEGWACGGGAVGGVSGRGGADACTGDHDIVGSGDGHLAAAVGDIHVIPVGGGGGANVVIEYRAGIGGAAVHGHGGLKNSESCGVGGVDLEGSDADVEGLVDIGLFKLWEDEGAPGVDADFGSGVAVGNWRDIAGGEGIEDVVVVVESDADLFEVIFALGASGGFAGLLYGREQESDEDRDDGDDDEEFDECEAASARGLAVEL